MQYSQLSSQDTYRQDLKEVGIQNAHDFRYTYAKNEFKKRLVMV